MLVQPPECLKKPLLVQHTTLMGAGPANCPPRVLHALSQPVTGHLHAETGKLMDDIKEGIKYVFQTRNTLTLCVSTAGHGAIEAVICNLLEPGEVAVITYHGVWGERISEMASRYGVIVKQLTTELGDVFPLKQIEESLIQHKPALLFVVQGESSTGCCQPIEGIGDLCHRYNCLLVVDTVASLASVPFKMDEWNVDVAYTGSQKCLGAPPGITPISFNKRAEEKIFSRKSPVPSYYLDIKELGDYWNCFGRPSRIYHHTVCTTLLYGLREALAMISEEGIENSIQRHQMCANRLYQGIDRMGLQLFVQDPRKRLPTITTVKIPDSTNWRLVCEYAMKTNHFELAAGVGPTTGKVFRLGVMGYNATFDKVDYLLKMLQESLIYARSKTSKL